MSKKSWEKPQATEVAEVTAASVNGSQQNN